MHVILIACHLLSLTYTFLVHYVSFFLSDNNIPSSNINPWPSIFSFARYPFVHPWIYPWRTVYYLEGLPMVPLIQGNHHLPPRVIQPTPPIAVILLLHYPQRGDYLTFMVEDLRRQHHHQQGWCQLLQLLGAEWYQAFHVDVDDLLLLLVWPKKCEWQPL